MQNPDAVSFFFFNTNITTLKSRGLYIKTKKKKKREEDYEGCNDGFKLRKSSDIILNIMYCCL